MAILLRLVTIILIISLCRQSSSLEAPWRWECQRGFCQKARITPKDSESALSLSVCRLFCSDGAGLWPRPTGRLQLGNHLVALNVAAIEFVGAKSAFFNGAETRFREIVEKLGPKREGRSTTIGKKLAVTLVVNDQDTNRLELETDEGYELFMSQLADGALNATIKAANYFGARHGLETLGQLIIHDDLRDEAQIVRDVTISDRPAYPYRGILLDTSRNYISVDAIKRTINAMGASKLNRFHWHITDSHSFPYVSKSHPELSKLGAYTPSKIYSPEDVADIVKFGLERGVAVIPEFDAPAHVGEGWQDTGLVTCFNKQPWSQFCVEPPCGQFDPTKDKLYDVLEDIYGDMLEQFNPDIFHMGGDEVHFGCWNSTSAIVDWMKSKGWGVTEHDFVKLWDHFQTKALERLYKKAGKELPVIMWTSTLTQKEYLKYLPKDKYIIQIWTTGNDPQVSNLLTNGYKLIISNYDALYLDCGFGGWVNDGNNWCSPYIGWQKVYENTPTKIAGARKDQVLGAEATLWTEQVDSSSLDGRLWPRAAAMGEVLWSEPKETWREAEHRMLVHRERLVARGIDSEALEPEWCLQNENNCPISEKDKDDTGAATTARIHHIAFSLLFIVTTLNYWIIHQIAS